MGIIDNDSSNIASVKKYKNTKLTVITQEDNQNIKIKKSKNNISEIIDNKEENTTSIRKEKNRKFSKLTDEEY